MNKIQKISLYVLAVLNILLLALPLFTIISWFFIDIPLIKSYFAQQQIRTPEGYVNLAAVSWSFFSKVLGISSQILKRLPFFLSLIILKSLFRNYKNNILFSSTNARYFRNLGLLFFFDALIAQPLSKMLMVLAVSLANPPGHRYISLSFGTPNTEALFYGAIILVISWVMLQASNLDTEQKLTI